MDLSVMDKINEAGVALTPHLFRLVLKGMAWRARLDPGFRENLYDFDTGSPMPWQARINFLTKGRNDGFHVVIDGGRIRTGNGLAGSADVTFNFRDLACMKKMVTGAPQEVIEMLLRNELVFDGNLVVVARFSYLLNRLFPKWPSRTNERHAVLFESELSSPVSSRPSGRTDEAPFIDDVSFPDRTIEDFPRLGKLRRRFFTTRPAISTERPRLLTENFRKNGFDRDPETGEERNPLLRQAEAFEYLMRNRRPIIGEDDLLAGTTTDKRIGVVLYPETNGTLIWHELDTIPDRTLNPYDIDETDRDLLNRVVFPYWMHRNVREVARRNHGNPTCMRLDERFVLYFQWKPHGISHTIPDFETVLSEGLVSVSERVRRLMERAEEPEKAVFYRAVVRTLKGVMAYSRNLASEAGRLSANEDDPTRGDELGRLAGICEKVPAGPADTLHEALQSIWVTFVGGHMENTNTALSLGRLDRLLQPFFVADVKRCESDDERRSYIDRAIELTGCFLLRCTDHLPLAPDIANKLFGGSSSDQALTVGGVTEGGENAVCDMTFVILKAAEMLRLRDPNLNARFHPEVNSDTYLRRLCEVNLITGATPSIHNDRAVIQALEQKGFSVEHARDWCATGCVEPTSAGRHYGHTGSIMVNLVAPLEMALYDGFHPLCDEVIGRRTGDARSFESYEEFYQAFLTQVRFLAEEATKCNNLYGHTHNWVRPTPFLSALMDGCLDSGRDAGQGGARYNSSGVAIVGLSDVVDSLTAIRQLVFEQKRVGMEALLDALRSDFGHNTALHARIMNRVPKFGDGDPVPIEIARRLMEELDRLFGEMEHYRSGRYNVGLWSMSHHVAFGNLSGALPSGRRAFEPFTPGITPSAAARAVLTEQIKTVASLDAVNMPNNMAFNVKVVPHPKDSFSQTVDQMSAYTRAYVELGGMQMQYNVMDTETMRRAMEHPEQYRDLMVRISGYNAYFVELDPSIQLELINRAEHGLGQVAGRNACDP